MTRKEILSKRKVKALRYLVESGEYSACYALDKLSDLYVEGIVLEVDYEPLAEYLDEFMDRPVELITEQDIDTEEKIESEVSVEDNGNVEILE